MSETLIYTLVADGISDSALLPIIDWTLSQRLSLTPQGEIADFRTLQKPPKSLSQRIARASELYRCQILFIHRDAEAMKPSERIQEIEDAVSSASNVTALPPYICVIPVRMQEAWMLFDEKAIRQAASNPNGKVPLDLPSPAAIEALPNPKNRLYSLLKTACGLQGRRLKNFRPEGAVHLVSQYIEDFSPLRALSAFQTFERDVQTFASQFQSE